MGKTYHFMAGLPRSGSTVLAALLNQHPDIYASPQTDMLGLMHNTQTAVMGYESFRAGVLLSGYESVFKGIPDLFYSKITKPVIIDKNRAWGTPYNSTNIMPYVNKNGKVIVVVRPILEVLASYVKVITKSEAKGNQSPIDRDFWAFRYRDPVDAMVEYIMRPQGELDQAIYSTANLLKNHKEKVKVVRFDDLLLDPQKTLSELYSFLGLAEINNNFKDIKEVDRHDDLKGYGVSGLHDIQKSLKSPGTIPEDYLSSYLIGKYKTTLDFLDLF
jgi:sulfotransferase